jgi:hypothetical protein
MIRGLNNSIFTLFITFISAVSLLTSGTAISYSQAQPTSQSLSDFQFPKLFVLWGGNGEGQISTSSGDDNYSEKPLKLRGIKTGQNSVISPDYEFPSNEKGSAVKSYPTIPQNVKFTITTTSIQGQEKTGSNNVDVESVAITPILSQDANGHATSLGTKITLDPTSVDSSGTLGYLLSNQKVGDYVLNVIAKPRNSLQQAQELVLGGYETRLQILPAEVYDTTTTKTTTITKRIDNGNDLDIALAIAKNPISRGSPQTITVTVSDADSKQKIGGAKVDLKVRYASGSTTNDGSYSGSTDSRGQASHTWKIGPNSDLGTFTAIAHVSSPGYSSETKTAKFTVIAANNPISPAANSTSNNNTIPGNGTTSSPLSGGGSGDNKSTFAILLQPPDPCLEDTSLPECQPIDPCLEDPTLEECQPIDPCLEDPTLEECQPIDPCLEDPETCAIEPGEEDEDDETIPDEGDDNGGDSGEGDDNGGDSGEGDDNGGDSGEGDDNGGDSGEGDDNGGDSGEGDDEFFN